MTAFLVLKYEANGEVYPVKLCHSYEKAQEIAKQHRVGRDFAEVWELEIE